MRKFRGRLMSILLSATMVISMAIPQVVSYADEDPLGFESVEESGGEYVPEEDPVYPDPPHDDYWLVSNSSYVSFGNVTQGSFDIPYAEIIITNTGSDGVEWDYFKSDPERVFHVDLPSSSYLGPGECMAVYVSMRSDANPGSYNGYIYFEPIEGATPANTAHIDLSGTIVSSSPRITYIAVNPGTVTVSAGSSTNFYADVRGENNPDTRVIWKIFGNTDAGTNIDGNGRVYVGPNETANSLQVSATSVIDENAKATADIIVQKGQFTVGTSANPNNGGTVGGGGVVSSGSSLSVVACPNNGFNFVNWTLDGKEVSRSPRYNIDKVTRNMNLVANFSATSCYVTVKSNYDKAGSVTGSQSVPYGGSLKLEAKVNSGYSFDAWYENGKAISTSSSFTLNNITSNREIHANFVQDIFSVKLQTNPSNGGLVSGDGNYKRNADVYLKAAPVEGYEFVNWVSNNKEISRDPNVTLKGIKQDYIIVANFQKKNVQTFEMLSSVAGGNGSISPAGKLDVAKGSNLTYTFTPNNGYVVSAVAVDGKQVGAINTYTFNNISGKHSIAVAFAKKAEPVATAPPKKQSSSTFVPAATAAPAPVTTKTEEKTQVPEEVKEATLVDEDGDGISETPLEEIAEDVEPATEPHDVIDMDAQTGILQKYNITPEQAMGYINDGTDKILMRAASEEQYLLVSVNNDFADDVNETDNLDYENVVSVPNLGAVVNSMLTPEEKMSIFAGHRVGINLNIFNNGINTINDDDREIAKSAFKDNVNIGRYFEIVLMKTTEGTSEIVTDIKEPVKIVLNVPESLKDSTRQFCIIRAHREADGSLRISYLPDEDENPDTITFTTNKFSSYAIGYVGGESIGTRSSMIIIGVIILLVIAIIVTVVTGISVSNAKKRRARARAKAKAAARK